jgi:hypothetical protein
MKPAVEPPLFEPWIGRNSNQEYVQLAKLHRPNPSSPAIASNRYSVACDRK